MYEYPDTLKLTNEQAELWTKSPIEFILKEFEKAFNHDSVLNRCYNHYEITHRIESPFAHKNFFIYLSYIALSMNQKHLKLCVTYAQHSVNPPIILQRADKYYTKETMDRLLFKEARGYWQKLWDAIRGR